MRGMLQAVFGRGPRGGAVNARAAAQSLGVSPGTVRRWAAGTQNPSPGRLAAIRQAARRTTTTKRGRRTRDRRLPDQRAGQSGATWRQQDLGQRRTRGGWIRAGLCARSPRRY